MSSILCRPRSLPVEKLEIARRRAILVNPANALVERTVSRPEGGRRGGPRRIAVVIARRWPKTGVKLTVSFLDGAKADLRKRILLHMNAWGKNANVQFVQTAGTGQVRIARLNSGDDAGYWSYIGTEILEIAQDEPTLNLDGFTMRTSEAEFTRVVRHEAGHTLGFDHEHMRSDIVRNIDREKAIAFYEEDQDWSPEEVEEQVLTPLSRKSIMGTTETDPVSIMCYHLPAEIMKDGKEVLGGKDINPRDHAFAATLYPKRGRAAPLIQAPALEEEVVVVAKPQPPAAPARVTPRELVAPRAEAADVFEIVVMDEFQPVPGKPGPRPEFAQVLASFRGARVSSAMRLRGANGEPTHFGSIIGMHERIKNYTNGVKGSLPKDKELMAFGTQLFDTLFQGDVRRLYDEARTLERRRLEVVFTSMIPWIGEKPWEFAYDRSRGSFLATEETYFTRNVLTGLPADRVVRGSGPIRILVASAQPVGYGRLSIAEEEAVIRRGFQPLIDEGLVQIEPLPRATPAQIQGALSNGNFQVVHFIGHGAFDEERGEGCLIFVDENQNEHRLGERSCRELFCGRNLSLVFLNACETGRAGRVEFNKGVAQSLVAHGLPALVANQYSVLDSSATSFAQHLYWCLAQGMSLGQAAREARIAVNCSLSGEPIDWAVPVLYARDSSMALWERPAAPSLKPATRVRRSARESTKAHAARIAVWDMDDVFPYLERTLAAMSGAQREFGFELADLSVPLDAWKLRTGRTKYLWAEQFARRVAGLPVELGVDAVACVTRHWMRSDTTTNLYGWWPDKGKPPILIFSVAGFEELAAAGPETDRVIANVMVAGLAGLYGDVDTHQGGSKTCPLFSNNDREFRYLSARLKFDAGCASTLRSVIGAARFEALNALLNVFE